MENAIPLEDLFKLRVFYVPQYQRAYAWEKEKHLSVFLSDLREQVKAQAKARKDGQEKTYFLGTLLLHDVGDGKIHVVDGQQRLTTSVIMVAAALQRNCKSALFGNGRVTEKKLKNYFIFSEVEDIQKFHTIAEDNPFFRTQILGLADTPVTEQSPSSRLLKEAFSYFSENVKDQEWADLIHTLISAKVMVYSVNNPADATLIFELQNDRGKKLTDLEALKSYLMHLIYLYARKPDDSLGEIQTQFANIYRHVEALSEAKKAPTEDAVLSYHCVCYLDWSSNEWRRPKDLIKQIIKEKPEEQVTKWVLDFVAALHETYKTVVALFKSLDDYTALADLIVLDRMGAFWPSVLKTYALDSDKDKQNFQLACRLMEVYAMRGYGISNLRSDAGLSSLYRKTRDFNGDFHSLHTYLHSMSNWYDIETRCEIELDHPSLYNNNNRDIRYMLWRYENHLRSQPGKKQGHLPWKQFLFPISDAYQLSIEHIAAQSNPVSQTEAEWEAGIPKMFHEVALHRLGNLVLDSKSANSAKGKYDFTDKLESLSKNSTFLSQGELIDWAEENEVGEYLWTIESIKKRHAHMKEFFLKNWNPNTYFPLSPSDHIQEDRLENGAGVEIDIGE